MPDSPQIVVAAEQPFPIEAMVFEEDTWRVLSAGNHIRDIREPLADLQHQAVDQPPARPGELILRGSRWFAILHDFDVTDSYRADAIADVLAEISSQIERRQIVSLGLQALGAHHGPEDLATVIARFETWHWPSCLERLWIAVRRE